MKNHVLFFVFAFITIFNSLFLTASAQQLIDNKGNRKQSYPVVTTTKPEVVHLINQVEQDSLEARIRYMQSFIRKAQSPAALIVQNWLIDHFESYGYDAVEDIEIHYFSNGSQSFSAGNVVVVKEGSDPYLKNEYILITSHYDHPDGPGADDNASGTSGVLECARLLKNFPTKRSIVFVPFNAEELWMVGSLPFAQKCATENMNIIAHFNMDMIGWFPSWIANTIMASGYSYISQALFEYYQQTANIYVPSIPTIRFSAGDSYGGDHMPFNMYEYPSLYIGDIEYHEKHPCYHSPCDTIGPYGGVNRLDLAKAFVQAVLASAAELANAWLPPQNLSACSGMDKITVSWDNAGTSVFYKIFKNNLFLTETTDNFYVDRQVERGEKYEYYVVAINMENWQESAPSNKDEITFVAPLQLPYSSNFKENKYGFEQNNWVNATTSDGVGYLCNVQGTSIFPDNYLTIAELDWFPISGNIEDISVRFKWAGYLLGIWKNAGMYFEVTTDRKTWHKLAYISGNNYNWINKEFSLNEYIGNNFFQARFRLESSGANNQYNQKYGFFANFEIGFNVGIDDKKETLPYISSFNFSPNPASDKIYIVTNQHEPYHIAIYDMSGKAVFVQDDFSDGQLNVAHLSKGNYLVVASTKQHRIAKKLVIQ